MHMFQCALPDMVTQDRSRIMRRSDKMFVISGSVNRQVVTTGRDRNSLKHGVSLGNTRVWGEIFSASSGAPSDKNADRFVFMT
jgi:hypothetical protein